MAAAMTTTEECAKCGTVGPVDVACRWCQPRMKRPAVGDRWQNRKTSRVCVVEDVKGGPDAALTRVGYRYERETLAGNRPRQWTNLPYFNVAFHEFEKVSP